MKCNLIAVWYHHDAAVANTTSEHNDLEAKEILQVVASGINSFVLSFKSFYVIIVINTTKTT